MFAPRSGNGVYHAIAPALIGAGVSFFNRLNDDVRLYGIDITPCRTGTVDLRYDAQPRRNAAEGPG